VHVYDDELFTGLNKVLSCCPDLTVKATFVYMYIFEWFT